MASMHWSQDAFRSPQKPFSRQQFKEFNPFLFWLHKRRQSVSSKATPLDLAFDKHLLSLQLSLFDANSRMSLHWPQDAFPQTYCGVKAKVAHKMSVREIFISCSSVYLIWFVFVTFMLCLPCLLFEINKICDWNVGEQERIWPWRTLTWSTVLLIFCLLYLNEDMQIRLKQYRFALKKSTGPVIGRFYRVYNNLVVYHDRRWFIFFKKYELKNLE